MSRLFREQRNDVVIAHPARAHDICFAQRRHGSAPVLALRRPGPEQVECGAVAAGLEQVGAERLREGGIVDLQRDILAGFLSGAAPARARSASPGREVILLLRVCPMLVPRLVGGVFIGRSFRLRVGGDRVDEVA